MSIARQVDQEFEFWRNRLYMFSKCVSGKVLPVRSRDHRPFASFPPRDVSFLARHGLGMKDCGGDGLNETSDS